MVSTEMRATLLLRAFDPLPAEKLAAHLRVELHFPDQYPNLSSKQVAVLHASDTWSAAIVQQNPIQILLHPKQTHARRESSLMHELSHVLLKHPMVSFDPVTGLPQRQGVWEDEATYLGGCLQVPRRGLLWAVQRHLAAPQIAAHFGASEEIIRFRSSVTSVRLKTL